MNIVVTARDGSFYSLEVSPDLEVENLLVLVSVESGKSADIIQLSHNGVPLVDSKKTLAQYSVTNGDMLLMTEKRPATGSGQQPVPPQPTGGTSSGGTARTFPKIDWASIQIPGSGSSAPVPQQTGSERIRQELLADPYQLSIIRQRDPTLGEAVNDPTAFAKVYAERMEITRKKKEEETLLLTGDPMDPEYQKKLYEQLQGKQIEENLEHAMEEHPESFGQVIMLYIDVEINGHKVKAFVDSGAQMTLISSSCAERCNVSRLIDKRFQGVAKGVGTQKILGRVHLLPLKIGADHFPCTFSVLENQPMDMLLGLDMLKRHQCVIDLKNNVLKIGTTGTTAPFLAEKDIPKQDETVHVTPESQAASQPGPSSDIQISDENITKLVAMGFTADQSKKALIRCGNSVELAASLLFERGGQLE